VVTSPSTVTDIQASSLAFILRTRSCGIPASGVEVEPFGCADLAGEVVLGADGGDVLGDAA